MTTVTCQHWIGSDSTGHRCTAPAEKIGLCAKHYAVELGRVQNRLDKDRAKTARDNAAWLARNLRNLPSWRVQLERAESEYARRTASAVDDRAAYGGLISTPIQRSQRALLSDTNVTRVIELERIIKRLRADIARAEKAAA